jgi:hypothetical protein
MHAVSFVNPRSLIIEDSNSAYLITVEGHPAQLKRTLASATSPLSLAAGGTNRWPLLRARPPLVALANAWLAPWHKVEQKTFHIFLDRITCL